MKKITIVGLGYVGLPLAVAFSKHFKVVGFDINSERINELKNHYDKTCEIETEELKNSNIIYTTNIEDIKDSNIYIVTVPTPIDKYKTPNLTPLIKASELIGSVLKKNDIVIYESTVYPGCTEDDCVPVLEKNSQLKFNQDFFVGYSPERINPGDKENRLETIKKVTSGSNTEIANEIDNLYQTIIKAGTFQASSIKVAEAAKVIENSQRDINIAFVNELSLIFDRMNIDTLEVLEAAGTKWNFLKFKPGMVGGHCIGVDPYYLTHKAESLNYHPEVILSGRRINDNMGKFVANKTIKLMIQKNLNIARSKILILGVAFKENCPDIRNSRVFDIIQELKEFHCDVEAYDPIVNNKEVLEEYNIKLIKTLKYNYDAIILAVAHNEFHLIHPYDILVKDGVLFDLKGFYDKKLVDARL